MSSAIRTALPLAALAISCATTTPLATRALEVERIQCEPGTGTRDDLTVIRSAKVIGAEPMYSYVASNAGDDDLKVVDGAKIVLRPPEAVTPERMSRILQCHSAQVLLGQQAMLADDPFWLANSWLTIDVKPEGGNYAVTLEAETVADNIKLARRAEAFARLQTQTGNSIYQ